MVEVQCARNVFRMGVCVILSTEENQNVENSQTVDRDGVCHSTIRRKGLCFSVEIVSISTEKHKLFRTISILLYIVYLSLDCVKLIIILIEVDQETRYCRTFTLFVYFAVLRLHISWILLNHSLTFEVNLLVHQNPIWWETLLVV